MLLFKKMKANKIAKKAYRLALYAEGLDFTDNLRDRQLRKLDYDKITVYVKEGAWHVYGSGDPPSYDPADVKVVLNKNNIVVLERVDCRITVFHDGKWAEHFDLIYADMINDIKKAKNEKKRQEKIAFRDLH